MCGIAGFHIFDPLAAKEAQGYAVSGLELAPELLACRGPDASGIWFTSDNRSGCAHTRLAIHDVRAQANQPFISAQTGNCLCFNGEIYNFRELRRQLESDGYPFQTNGDTEVLLAMYDVHGEQCLEQLEGMFAFVIFDVSSGSLFCARDRIGKKPFVYSKTSDGFYFGSNIPSVISFFPVAPALNEQALWAYLLLNLRHVPEPATVYQGIHKLRPGFAMSVATNGEIREWSYWRPDPPELCENSHIRTLLKSAVNTRMEADVPVALLLSGGLDSTLIAHEMHSQHSKVVADGPLRSYAMGKNSEDSDLVRARAVASTYGFEHREFYYQSDDILERFELLLRQHGEPVMLLPLCYIDYLCEQVKSDGVSVLLSGVGADELFYGYDGGYLLRWLDVLQRLVTSIGFSPSLLPERWRSRLEFLLHEPGMRKVVRYQHAAQQLLPELFQTDPVNFDNLYLYKELERYGKQTKLHAVIDEFQFIGLMLENSHSITLASDLAPMRHAIEMRAPFLDRALVEGALAIPAKRKVGLFSGAGQTKKVLRSAYRTDLPADIRKLLESAPKRGFGYEQPEGVMLAGPWFSLASDLFEGASDADGLLNRTAIRSLWKRWSTEARVQLGRGGNVHGGVADSLIARLFALQFWLQKVR
jgi:asparagine synthase (glutamine-hydrolysing)